MRGAMFLEKHEVQFVPVTPKVEPRYYDYFADALEDLMGRVNEMGLSDELAYITDRTCGMDLVLDALTVAHLPYSAVRTLARELEILIDDWVRWDVPANPRIFKAFLVAAHRCIRTEEYIPPSRDLATPDLFD